MTLQKRLLSHTPAASRSQMDAAHRGVNQEKARTARATEPRHCWAPHRHRTDTARGPNNTHSGPAPGLTDTAGPQQHRALPHRHSAALSGRKDTQQPLTGTRRHSLAPMTRHGPTPALTDASQGGAAAAAGPNAALT